MYIHTHTQKGAQKLGLLSSNGLLTKPGCGTIFQILRLFDHSCVHPSAPVAGRIAQEGNSLAICWLSAKSAVKSLQEIPLSHKGNLKPRFSNCGSTRHLFRVIWSLRCSSHIITPSPCCADGTVHRLFWELTSWSGFARANIRSYNIFLTHFERALSKISSPGATGSGRARGTCKSVWAWASIQDQELEQGAELCCTQGTTRSLQQNKVQFIIPLSCRRYIHIAWATWNGVRS